MKASLAVFHGRHRELSLRDPPYCSQGWGRMMKTSLEPGTWE